MYQEIFGEITVALSELKVSMFLFSGGLWRGPSEVGWGRVRSTEVARVFGALFGRPDGFGSSDFAQIVFVHALSIYMGFGNRFY